MKFVKKRNGNLEQFSESKILNAITAAFKATNVSVQYAKFIAQEIITEITGMPSNDTNKVIDVEIVQDLIEKELMKAGHYEVAKEFILYREKRTLARTKQWDLTEMQRNILNNKYAIGESFEEFLERVSAGNADVKRMMREKKFLPAGRILAHRGKNSKTTLSNCYVLAPPQDNIEGIFYTAGQMAKTFAFGGGVGIDLGLLRPRGMAVNNSAKTTTGSVSFADLYNLTSELIGQEGRRGALMLSLPVSHPDIEEFVSAKATQGALTKCNMSVRISDKFMLAAKHGEEFVAEFISPEIMQSYTKVIDVDKVMADIVHNNLHWAEPGILFWDTISNYNLLSGYDDFEFAGVNPCAEEPLPAGGACCLASINLSEFVVNAFEESSYFDMNEFITAIHTAVIFLNDILDEGLPKHPLEEQKKSVGDWRQIGLGVMGFADMLIKLGMTYGDEDSISISHTIGEALFNTALQTSSLIASNQGTFKRYDEASMLKSPMYKNLANKHTKHLIDTYGLRNSQILSVAPTGSISTLLGVSGGIEPIYAKSYTRKTESLHGTDVTYQVYTPIVKEYMDKFGLTDEKDLPDFFITSMEIPYQQRIMMQSIWQKYIDAAISSTINLPFETTEEEVREIVFMAWESGLKGITVFRDGCARAGILNVTKEQKKEELCPNCESELNSEGGCTSCVNCGWSRCDL